jgi:signal transduction histidine kinase
VINEEANTAGLVTLAIWASLGWCPAAGASAQALTSAQQVLDLGLDVARQTLLPVHLEGLVTYPEPGANLIYVQDSSAGIRVVYTNATFQPVSGQRVIVEGTAAGGVFAPFIDCANVRVVGLSDIPEPCEAPAARMAAGELFGQWVQVEGVVRDVAREPDRALLFVSSGGLRFHAVLQPFPGMKLPLEWLEARIALRGVCWTEVDAENKPVGFTLYVPGTNQIAFEHPGQRDPFGQPALSLASHPELRRQSDARVKVAGIVVYHSPSGHIYLQDAGGAVHARLLVPLARANSHARYVERPLANPLRPGERVELVGAPTAALFSPFLQDAEFRRVGEGPPPQPTPVSVSDVFSGNTDSQLISLKARLLASEVRQAGSFRHQVLALQNGDTLFEALWEFTGSNSLPAWPKNSYVQAAGICAVQLGELNQVRTFRLLLRSPMDLRLLGRPPWWEPLPVGKLLAGAATVSLTALMWIGLLRRQVAQRTAQLRAEVAQRQQAQTELRLALAAERELGELRSRFISMVSHEFRTPLGVILSAAENLESYFERLKPEQRRTQLDNVIHATRQMARVMENVLLLGRAEAAKLQFKPAPLDLAAFCQAVVGEVKSATQSRCPISFGGGPFPPARADEALLRHILLNLLTNAVAYSLPGRPVEFSAERKNGNAVLRIQDRGLGIPPADQAQLFTSFHRGRNVSHLPGTGLGLVIVKRCVELHRGQITCVSVEGDGSTFTVTLPLFP